MNAFLLYSEGPCWVFCCDNPKWIWLTKCLFLHISGSKSQSYMSEHQMLHSRWMWLAYDRYQIKIEFWIGAESRGQRHYNLWSNFFSGVFPQAPIIPVKYYVAGAENNAIFWRKSSFSPPPSSIKSSQRSEQNCPFVVQKWDKALKTRCVAKCFQKKREGTVFNKLSKLL